jgi:hypothetical protein
MATGSTADDFEWSGVDLTGLLRFRTGKESD